MKIIVHNLGEKTRWHSFAQKCSFGTSTQRIVCDFVCFVGITLFIRFFFNINLYYFCCDFACFTWNTFIIFNTDFQHWLILKAPKRRLHSILIWNSLRLVKKPSWSLFQGCKVKLAWSKKPSTDICKNIYIHWINILNLKKRLLHDEHD